jgi:peptidoglycan/LPS O-acetylase OafA/YrhL
LRALSIVLVVGYHAQPWLAAGGFIGVDIFFVISGFFITGIILTELDVGTFARFRRLNSTLAGCGGYFRH